MYEEVWTEIHMWYLNKSSYVVYKQNDLYNSIIPFVLHAFFSLIFQVGLLKNIQNYKSEGEDQQEIKKKNL